MKLDRQQIENIRAALPVTFVLNNIYGYDVPQEGRMFCPFCSGEGGNKKASIDSESLHCFACGAYDVFDIILDFEPCPTFPDAVNKAAEYAGLTEQTPEITAQLEERRQKAIAKRKEQAQEIVKLQAEAAQIARGKWDNAKAATNDNKYLKSKGIPSLALRMADGWLLVPVYNADGELMTLQLIDTTGFKRFMPSGKTRGGFFPIPAKDKSTSGILYICEGYATAASIHLATGQAVLVAFNANNLLLVAQIARTKYPDREIVIAADNDEYKAWERKKNVGIDAAIIAARVAKGKIATPKLAKGGKCDFNDLHAAEGLEVVKAQLEAATIPPPKISPEVEVKPEPKLLPVLRVVGLGELLSLDIPPRNYLLYPIIQEQGLIMLFADRGTGKTFVALWIAYAVATGGQVFLWKSNQAWPVLYIDGEMPFSAMQGRIADIVASTDLEPQEGFFNVLTPDLQGNDTPMPNLATQDGQAAIEPYLQGIKLVVIDNLATLCRHGRSNDEESWQPVQEWVLSLRRRGISVLIVHHASKNGSQRGTSAKEDILDTSIQLRRPKDYNPEQGARFEVHLTKARGIFGADAEPFEAQLTSIDGLATWTVKSIEDAQLEQIRTLAADDATQRDIAEELGISTAKVNRLCKKHNIATKGGRR